MNTRLKSAREQIGLTQVAVARKARISERQYIRIEQGERDPRATVAIRIARALDSTVEELFGAATPDTTKKPDGNQAK